METNGSGHRPLLLMGVAVAVGVGMAVLHMRFVSPASAPLPADVIARVNDTLIRREDFERALDSLASDRRTQIDDAQRKRVLDRMIDEELLVQYALTNGVLRNNSRVRSDLVTAVASAVTAEFTDAQPNDTALAKFYEAEMNRFIEPGRTRIRQIFFRVAALGDAPGAEARARAGIKRLRAGAPFAQVQEELSDPPPVSIPDTPLSDSELREYLGPTVARTVATLAVDAISEPIRSGTGFHVVQVIARLEDAAPPLAEIRPKVVDEYRRIRSEEALRSYLNDLRRQADIEIRSDVPEPLDAATNGANPGS